MIYAKIPLRWTRLGGRSICSTGLSDEINNQYDYIVKSEKLLTSMGEYVVSYFKQQRRHNNC